MLLLGTWSVMTLAAAYSQNLANVDSFYTRSLCDVDLLDNVVNAIDRLDVDQRAVLSSGDQRFSDGVWASVVELDRHSAELKALADRNPARGARAAQLSASLRQVLDLAARSDDIKDTRGRRAALAFFDASEGVISLAKSQAGELKEDLLRSLRDQVLKASTGNSLLKAMLHGAPAGIALGPSAAARLAPRAPL